MFKRDKKDSLYYESENGIIYSLLEGFTDNKYSSEIVFIFREASEEDHNNGFHGEVVNWLYCGFEDLDFIEICIKEYEEKKGIRANK